jgi:hypothetical protein
MRDERVICCNLSGTGIAADPLWRLRGTNHVVGRNYRTVRKVLGHRRHDQDSPAQSEREMDRQAVGDPESDFDRVVVQIAASAEDTRRFPTQFTRTLTSAALVQSALVEFPSIVDAVGCADGLKLLR